MLRPQDAQRSEARATANGNKPACHACVDKEYTPYIVEALAVFHLLMSSLKVGLLAKTEAMLVTAAVFQYPIGPYVLAAVVELVIHAVTAAPMFASMMHVSMPAFPQAQVGYTACSVAPHVM